MPLVNAFVLRGCVSNFFTYQPTIDEAFELENRCSRWVLPDLLYWIKILLERFHNIVVKLELVPIIFGCGVGCVGCVWLYWLLFCARNAAQATGEELPNFRLDRNILVYVIPCRLIRE